MAVKKADSEAVRKKLEEALESAIMKDIRDGKALCNADFRAPMNQTFSLDQIAETFGLTRPRVQQIEARAREKILRERESLVDY